MKQLFLINNEQEVGQYYLEREGRQKMIPTGNGAAMQQTYVQCIQSWKNIEFRFKLGIPLVTRQEYEMIGFDGEIPSIKIITEAWPILKMPDNISSKIGDPQATKVQTKTSFQTSATGKNIMQIETR